MEKITILIQKVSLFSVMNGAAQPHQLSVLVLATHKEPHSPLDMLSNHLVMLMIMDMKVFQPPQHSPKNVAKEMTAV